MNNKDTSIPWEISGVLEALCQEHRTKIRQILYYTKEPDDTKPNAVM